jgi:hypothetical protein
MSIGRRLITPSSKFEVFVFHGYVPSISKDIDDGTQIKEKTYKPFAPRRVPTGRSSNALQHQSTVYARNVMCNATVAHRLGEI